MKALALQPRRATVRGDRHSAPPPVVLAQRKSTFGPGAIVAPSITDGGQSLDQPTLSSMESGFGRDFGHIRVHDDARAHDNARSLDARAYAAGDHIVFGEGSYRPETASGRALIAHELAHSVQQGGVQMKSVGPLPAIASASLEAEADHAAEAVASGRTPPALSRIGTPAVFRSASDSPAPGGAAQPDIAGPTQKLPPDMTAIVDDPKGLGTTELVVSVPSFTLPLEKGDGDWVQKAYDQAATGGRLVFSPLIEGNRIAAYKEGREDYKSIWLGNFGFSSTKALASAFKASDNNEVKTALGDKKVAGLVKGMETSLQASGCDIDHIVEKQVGGTSIPSNLQLLTSKKNQDSGSQTYKELVKLANAIRDPGMRGPKVRKIQIQIKAATVPTGTADASSIVEGLLRKGQVKGSDAVKAKAEGKPVALTAGGVGETVNVRDTGRSEIDASAKRVIPGMRLVAYARSGGKGKPDAVEGELDSRAISKTGAKSAVQLTAELPAGGGEVKTDPTPAGAPPEGAAAGGESRILRLSKSGNSKIAFYYPYLSPGELTSVALDDKGNLTGKGVIHPTIPIFKELQVSFAADSLSLDAPIPSDKLKTPIPGFRFTSGQLSLQLSPEFVPSGNLKFEIGPAGKPVVLGSIDAKAAGGAFVATGTLTPGAKVPGISEAAGQVEYHSDKGWAGKLTAKSTSMPNSTIAAELGFTSGKDGFHAYGTGGITTKIKDSELKLTIGWHGGPVSYNGSVTLHKPLPLVDQVTLDGGYEENRLWLKGKTNITWKALSAEMEVTYARKDGEDGKFSGYAKVKVPLGKAEGYIDLHLDENGHYYGAGEISYAITKNIVPKLGVELTKDQRVKVRGEVKTPDIPLTKMWPAPDGGKIEFFKGVGAKFSIPTPIPGVTAYGEVRASAGIRYGIGPLTMKELKVNAELYPLEDDPKIKAHLTGGLKLPAFASIYGKFGAYIGAEVLAGAAGAKGGIDIMPSLGVKGEAGVDINADYGPDGFSVEGKAYAEGTLSGDLGVDLSAEVYGLYGLLSHTWTWNVGNWHKDLGSLKLSLGKIAYGKDGQITWPSLSDIKPEPESLDPLSIVKDAMDQGKAKEVPHDGTGTGSEAE